MTRESSDSREKPRKSSRRARQGPTIADVARAADVSPMTVSRVINGEDAVLPATREKVRQAIDHLGYVPNQAARTLAGGRQCRIALLHDNPSAAWLTEVLVGCLAQVSEGDAQLLVERCDGVESSKAFVRTLVSHRIDGVILPPPLSDDAALLQALNQAGLPMVQVATGCPFPAADAVSIDDFAAARDMTRHLIALGHKRIGFITGDPNQAGSALRRDGYSAAMRDASITPEPEWIVQGDFSYRSGLAAAESLLAVSPRLTAIFASNDDMAAASVAVAHRHRVDVPKDISICGFDDTAMATTIWPELTTVRQPIAEMAGLATRLLIDAVRAKLSGQVDKRHHERLSFEMVRRASDGAPPRSS